MERMLDVYLHELLVGHLVQDDGGQMSFEYLESWLAQPGAAALSHSLPLRATGSLSRAKTATTSSWTRRNGSRRMNRASAGSTSLANLRDTSNHFYCFLCFWLFAIT